jgi:hypothetical protein
MKKLMLALVFSGLVFYLHAHAMLMGFTDGMGLWDENGVQQYTCFPDNTCVGLDNKIYQKPDLLGTDLSNPPPATSEVPAILPEQPIINSKSISMDTPTTAQISGAETTPADNSAEKPQDTSLIDCSNIRSNCQISVTADNISVLIKTIPDAVVTLTFDGAEVQPTEVEQGLATAGMKHTLYSEDGLTLNTEHTYSLRVETASGWDVKEATVTTKAE